MKGLAFVSAFIMQLGVLSAYGQLNLSEMLPASTDSLQRNNIRYFSPGRGGQNIMWDFSKKLGSRESSQVMFLKDSAGVVSVIVPDKTSYYRAHPDTLILFGSESPLEKREYAREKPIRKFPLEYGDSLSQYYRCEGMYCGNHPFREEGTTTVKVDAIGSIVLTENDTVRHVRRVHTIDSYSVCMDLDSAALDTAKLTQVIEERYEWFVPGSQYPMIENVISTTYYNMEVIGTTKYAFCNLSEDKTACYVTPLDEETLDEEGPDDSFENEGGAPDIIHYHIGTMGKVITITYDLDSDASIGTIVASHMGMTYSHREWIQKAGEGYSVQIDCNGLRPGIY
ncbi:MAG: hypothetical protein K6F43_06355, partial [Prevotella sp.]|nr:hypothetical protein [Prevotella sp.]